MTDTIPAAIAQSPRRLAIYHESLAKGNTPLFAEMCAMQQAPGTMGTDRAYSEGRGHRDQFEGNPYTERIGRDYRKKAAEVGVSTQGKYYSAALAQFPGDPRAWISGIDDARRVIKETGMGATGSINCEPAEFDPGPEKPYQVAEDLVDKYTNQQIAANPEIAPTPKEKADLKEKVREQLSPNY